MQDDTKIVAAHATVATTDTPPTGGAGQSMHEPERVIRTYASDLAAVTHTPQPATVARPQPVQPPSLESEVKPVVPQEDRNAILARLRARTAAVTPPPATALPSAADRLIEASALTPTAPETFVPPAPTQPPPLPEKIPDGTAGLHTYKNDFAERIEEKGASALSVLAAESDAHAREVAPEPVKKTSVALVLVGIVIALLGAAAVYATYGYLKTNSPVIITPSAPSLIFVDERQELSGSGHDLLVAFAESASRPLAVGGVRLVYTSVSTTTAGVTSSVPTPGGALIKNLELPAPDILLRSIQPESTAGVVHAGTSAESEQRPFFILRVDSYERSFAGMLAWEPTIVQDLALLYPSYPAATPLATLQSVATTTSVTPAPATTRLSSAPLVFKDEVVGSHDIRVLYDGNGRSLLMYGYWNPTTLIIARDVAAFTELVNRLATTRQQ